MVQTPHILWLDEASAVSEAWVGGKAAHLATMLQHGFAVPAGFCITIPAFTQLCRQLGIEPAECGWSLPALDQKRLPADWEQLIRAAYRRLGAKSVAVRSSATAEDSPRASFAGQQQTYLNVRDENELIKAVLQCWGSLWTERAICYRQKQSRDSVPAMAVIVQTMVPCDTAGVAFSLDPVSGAQTMIIEAAAGLGEGVVGGLQTVERYAVSRTDLNVIEQPRLARLSHGQVDQIANQVKALEQLFGGPQDVEWGFFENKLHILQSRPVTVLHRSFFHDLLPNDHHLWTNAFLSERFPQPVSPLGWTLVRDLLEPLAFKDPVRFLGCRLPASFPFTKLYRGHPYVNARLFELFYRPFPDALLPEDARRFFPNGDTQLRKTNSGPGRFRDFSMPFSLLFHGLRDPANWSPWHNHRHWQAYLETHRRFLTWLTQYVNGMTSQEADLPRQLLFALESAQAQSSKLLAIHRWSLLHAEFFHTLLKKLLARWIGSSAASELAPLLLTGLPNKSLEANRALAAIKNPADLAAFIERYGHRSFSLDVYQPTFSEISGPLCQWTHSPLPAPSAANTAQRRQWALDKTRQLIGSQSFSRLRTHGLSRLLQIAEHYIVLREEQRFFWQQILAQQRRLILRLGQHWLQTKSLAQPDQIFFLTWNELREACLGSPVDPSLPQQRWREFEKLQQDYSLAPISSYPPFLEGNHPSQLNSTPLSVFHGTPVSPGVARGPARVILNPSQLDLVQPGEVLVTLGADPGWTPVFGRIAALVMEVGGQLSHGAVVAREYGLPAVAGLPSVTQKLVTGQCLLVDGTSGTVEKL
jgi:rifampicin phosphotransferase